jgi:AcrR family transcriptional regulator
LGPKREERASAGTSRLEARRARRRELVEAAKQAIRLYGPGVSMEHIAAEAGVTKPVLYRYFGDRAGLCQMILEDAVEDIIASVRQVFLEERELSRRIERAIDAYLTYIEGDTRVFQLLRIPVIGEVTLGGDPFEGFVRKVGNEIASLSVAELSATGMDALDIVVRSHGIVGMVFAVSEWWLEGQLVPRDRLVRVLSDLVYQGMRAPLPSEPDRQPPDGRRSQS